MGVAHPLQSPASDLAESMELSSSQQVVHWLIHCLILCPYYAKRKRDPGSSLVIVKSARHHHRDRLSTLTCCQIGWLWAGCLDSSRRWSNTVHILT